MTTATLLPRKACDSDERGHVYLWAPTSTHLKGPLQGAGVNTPPEQDLHLPPPPQPRTLVSVTSFLWHAGDTADEVQLDWRVKISPSTSSLNRPIHYAATGYENVASTPFGAQL